jgi:hypothetical protein
MPRVQFSDLPDHGRLWVFPLSRTLESSEVGEVLRTVDEFLDQWAAHGAPLRSARDFRDDRFLLIGVDVDAEAPSGCSIDALVNRLRVLGSEFEVTFIDHSPVWYRAEHGIESVSRADFRALANAGEVSETTPVFDSSLSKVGQLREGALEKPASQSWHGRTYFGTAARS